jgi:uncharacterized protein with LGFP repeats
MIRRARLATIAFLCFAPASAGAFQPFAVYGAIKAKWVQLGGASGPLGAARSSEADAARGGRFNAFASGFIYWHPRFGAHAVYGLIGEKWSTAGRENGFGYPLTDEMPGDNGGRFNDFERNATITFHPKAGTHVVYGFIRDAWVRLGRETRNGRCGYPTSDEYDAGAYRRSNFQKGYIVWRKGAGAAEAHCAVPFDDGTALNPVHG